MPTLNIDLEAYSDIDIVKCGAYRYAADPSTEITLFGYSVDGGPTRVIDLCMPKIDDVTFDLYLEQIPHEIWEMIVNPNYTKKAFNAEFEFIMLKTYMKKHNIKTLRKMDIEQWQDTAVKARYASLPASLGDVSKILFPNDVDKQKDSRGKALITFFCKPRKPTKNNPSTRNRPEDFPEKWKEFTEYCRQDVVAEMAIDDKLTKGGFMVPNFEWQYWWADARINMRGIKVDMDLVRSAMEIDRAVKKDALDEMREISGIVNPNSLPQIKEWLAGQGWLTEGLAKDVVEDMLKNEDLEPHVRRFLELRLLVSGTAVKKYQTLERSVCPDGRVRGLLMFYGASRTGREAGRLVQPQNLKRIDIEDEDELDMLREAVKWLDWDTIDMMAPDNILSQLIRTAFIAEYGRKMVVCDLSAIEARVTAWLAGEDWRIKVFVEGGDIYCASASMMFNVPVKKHGVNGHLRQKGKIAELALGYGGGLGALTTMGGEKMGLTVDEMETIKDKWRIASPAIVDFWWAVGRAAMNAIKMRQYFKVGPIGFHMMNKTLVITLPSGRQLFYLGATIGENKFGGECVEHWGMNQEKHKWMRIKTYGPKLVENIVQATSRDLLFNAIWHADKQGLEIVLHVHDEIVLDAPEDFDKQILHDLMTMQLIWTKGLPLNAEAQEAAYYCK